MVGTATGGFTEFSVPVPNARRWSPDDPFLYDLKVTLLGASGAAVDTVTSYFGMREIGKKLVDGVLRPTLNGEFVFQIGTLDQGFWPDGLYTAPTDAALASDLQKHKDLGFNMVRKHIKVEPARWYYHADRLGLLVWQDIPPPRPSTPTAPRRRSPGSRPRPARSSTSTASPRPSSPTSRSTRAGASGTSTTPAGSPPTWRTTTPGA